MKIRNKRIACAIVSIVGFAIAYHACITLELGCESYGTAVALMLIGVGIYAAAGYKGGLLV